MEAPWRKPRRRRRLSRTHPRTIPSPDRTSARRFVGCVRVEGTRPAEEGDVGVTTVRTRTGGGIEGCEFDRVGPSTDRSAGP
eukprot:scaffold281_cov318-Pavlova_lutheri.AAC.56